MIRNLAVVALGVLLALPAEAQTIGRLIYGRGQAQLMRSLQPVPLLPGTPLNSNDTMRVQIGGSLKAILSDDSIVMIWEDTEVRLENVDIDYIQGKRIVEIEQVNGQMRYIAGDFLGATSRIRIRTPNAKIELDAGGDIVVRQGVQGDNTEIVCIAGTPTVEHVFSEFEGRTQLEPQQTSIVGVERAPSQPVFMDRQAYDRMLGELLWTLPQPIPDWQGYFERRLENYAVKSFGRVRRLAAKPTTPIRTFVEGLTEQHLPTRAGEVRPEPFGNLNVEWTYENVVD